MNQLHTFGWYAKKISPLLPKKAFKPVPSRLWGGLAYFMIAVAGLLAIGLFDLHLLYNFAIAILLGLSYAGMGFLGHEILHGTVIRKSWLRDLLGTIAFWPLNTGSLLWRTWHNLNHHVYTQHEEKDPDAWPSLEQFLDKPLLKWTYRLPLPIRSIIGFISLSITFTIHSFMMLIRFTKELNRKKKSTIWLQLILPWSSWIGLLFVIGFNKWLFAYLLPLLIANFIVMSYISTNHRLNPLVDTNDPLANSLSLKVPKWVNILHFNFSLHTEHHIFPGMNPKYYPLVKKHIKALWPERYHEMPLGNALKALWKTPRIYYKKKEVIDPYQGKLYGLLGNGLTLKDIKIRKINLEK